MIVICNICKFYYSWHEVYQKGKKFYCKRCLIKKTKEKLNG